MNIKNTNKKLLRFSSLLLIVSLLAVVIPSSAVHAAFPGLSGKIAFYSDRDGNSEIYSMNADGTGQVNLTSNPANDLYPRWSPDGRKIAFTSNRDGNLEVYTMNADGSNQTRLTTNATSDFIPAWSPDGAKLTFNSDRDGNNEIYSMNSDGTGQVRLTNNAADDLFPVWSPNGTKIAFSSSRGGSSYEIYSMNPDGTNVIQLSNNTALINFMSDWSPSGSKITFSVTAPPPDYATFTMNADGTGRTQITSNPGNDSQPAYSPDGGSFAFTSNRDGNFEIYKMGTDGSNPIRLTTTAASEFGSSWQPLTIAPIANDDPGVATAANQPVTVNVLSNDTADPYGPLNPASVTVTAQPANGTTSVNATTGAITYTPNAGFTGTNSFTYRVCSSASSALCDTAVVSITVTAAATPTAPNTGTGQTPIAPSLVLLVAGTVVSLAGLRSYTKRHGYKISSRT